MSQFNYNGVNIYSAMKHTSAKAKPTQSKALKVKTGRIRKSTSPKKAAVKKVKKVAVRKSAQHSVTIRKTITTTVTAKSSSSESGSRSRTATKKKSNKSRGKK